MPILTTSVTMDAEDYLPLDGSLDSPEYGPPSSPLDSSVESQIFSSNSWQTPYGQQFSMQSERQYTSTSTTMAPMDVFEDFDDLSRNEFPQDFIDELSNNSLFSSPRDSASDYGDTMPHTSTAMGPWAISGPGLNQRENLSRTHAALPAIINTPLLRTYQTAPPEEEEEADEEETEELGHVDTYAEYKPSKSTIGISHPDIVVETNTLSSVPPPDVTYTLSIPETTISTGLLSALQLEAIIYACQQHDVILQNGMRAGFLIGDGAGVGKGRTVAGIILENYLKGRKRALWFSVSNDLKYDAERDLKDIDAPNIPVHALNKIKYGDTSTSEGVLFATYSALIGESQAGGQHRTRLKQILDWCKPNFDGVIVFDECHKAKNATSTKMGKAVLDLQSKLPKARVVYASATGASEPKNMIYMSRLGIWGEGTPFKTFEDFLHAIEKRGVGAMEIVAMDMKVSGMYIARQLSFAGVSFCIEEIALDAEFKLVYNKAARLWAEALVLFLRAADTLGLVSRKSLWGQFWSAHQRFFKYLCISAKVRRLVELAKTELEQGKCIVIGLQSTGEARTREVLDENDGHLDRFVSAAEGVFQSLVQKHFPLEKPKRDKPAGNKRKRKPRGRPPKYPKHSKAIVGEVISISDSSSCESDGMYSYSNSSPETPLDNDDVIFVNHINGHTGTPSHPPPSCLTHAIEKQCNECLLPQLTLLSPPTAKLEELKQGLLSKISDLGKELPLNTLDALIDRFGGPENVAEMTGRKGRVVRHPDGTVRYESRAEQGLTIDHVNIREKERFMCGEKLVAIISEAASSGISLQADKRVQNQRRRVHMTLELPWSADRAIQQFGRTHRSNQVTAPEYVFLISELAGERRFASIVAKRLESLGALTHGDRRATESRDLSKFNFENKYGNKALDRITKAIQGHIKNTVPVPKEYPGGDAVFFRTMKQCMMDVGILCSNPRFVINGDKDCTITKFLNRILGLEVHQQNFLFQYFTDNFEHLIEKDKKEGKYDMGILDLAPGNDEIREETQERFLTAGNPQEGQVILYKISVDRGMPWEEAVCKAGTLTGEDEGFYLSHKLRGSMPCVLLAEQGRGRNLVVYKPNIGKQAHPESLDNLQLRYHKVTPDEAKDCWENQFEFSLEKCSHAHWKGKCKQKEMGHECWLGMRLKQYHMLCGSLLRVWKRVADIVSDITNSSILQIVRLKTKQNSKQVGIKIPENSVERVRAELKQMDGDVKRQRQEREQRAQEKLHTEQLLLRLAKLRSTNPANPGMALSSLFPRSTSTSSTNSPRALPALVKKELRDSDEVLDLTHSPSPSPDSSTAEAGLGADSGPTLPETFHLEALISQERQREQSGSSSSSSTQAHALHARLLQQQQHHQQQQPRGPHPTLPLAQQRRRMQAQAQAQTQAQAQAQTQAQHQTSRLLLNHTNLRQRLQQRSSSPLPSHAGTPGNAAPHGSYNNQFPVRVNVPIRPMANAAMHKTPQNARKLPQSQSTQNMGLKQQLRTDTYPMLQQLQQELQRERERDRELGLDRPYAQQARNRQRLASAAHLPNMHRVHMGNMHAQHLSNTQPSSTRTIQQQQQQPQQHQQQQQQQQQKMLHNTLSQQSSLTQPHTQTQTQTQTHPQVNTHTHALSVSPPMSLDDCPSPNDILDFLDCTASSGVLPPSYYSTTSSQAVSPSLSSSSSPSIASSTSLYSAGLPLPVGTGTGSSSVFAPSSSPSSASNLSLLSSNPSLLSSGNHNSVFSSNNGSSILPPAHTLLSPINSSHLSGHSLNPSQLSTAPTDTYSLFSSSSSSTSLPNGHCSMDALDMLRAGSGDRQSVIQYKPEWDAT
ncbi:protein strawberry notch homolog 2-like isoform X2 [Engraulis encrasicolus]|uniref:protein strawberry notch homolog 2-like isoform X2 n=1 Tax=Engraulis encrasicolus TaxID=184585 RepID=UPI002FD36670